jgi:hypothetical protein
MVFKAMEMSDAGAVMAVTSSAIESAYRESETWIERVSQAEGTELQTAITSSLQKDTEPYLLQYVIAELNEPLEDGTELNDEEKGEVFFVLKTVISSLRTEDKGKIIEVE